NTDCVICIYVALRIRHAISFRYIDITTIVNYTLSLHDALPIWLIQAVSKASTATVPLAIPAHSFKVVCHEDLVSPHQFAARRSCAASARPWPAQYPADASRRSRGLLHGHGRPADVRLLRGLSHRHLAGPFADSPRRAHSHLRLLRRGGDGGGAAARADRQSLGLAGIAAALWRRAGHAVHGHRKLAQRPGQRRAAWPGVRPLHGREPRRAGGGECAAEPRKPHGVHPVRPVVHVDRRGATDKLRPPPVTTVAAGNASHRPAEAGTNRPLATDGRRHIWVLP